MKQKAEEIYHRFVNYEWNDVSEGLKKSILEAIETALKEGQKLPIPAVVEQRKQFKCRNVSCNEMVSVDSDEVFCEKHKRRLGI